MSNARDKANIPVLNFQSKGIDDNADATAITINSSENVLINTTSASGFDAGGLPLLVGNGSTHQGLTIYTGTSHTGAIHFADGTGAGSYRGQINYRHDTDALQIAVAGSEKMRLTSTGLGIGTSSPNRQLTVQSTTNAEFSLTAGNSSKSQIFFADTDDTNIGRIEYEHTNNAAVFWTNDAERMRITNAGKVGIGETDPHGRVHIKDGNSGDTAIDINNDDLVIENSSYAGITLTTPNNKGGGIYFSDPDVAASGRLFYDHAGNFMTFTTNNSERMRINSSGNVGIGTSNPSVKFTVDTPFQNAHVTAIKITQGGGWSNSINKFKSLAWGDPTTLGAVGVTFDGSKALMRWHSFYNGAYKSESDNIMQLTGQGNLTVSGSISKGSGSFTIDHPLPSKKETHNLVHSFVEAPQADNIYRGKIDLVNGTATINIDTNSEMSDGTFVLLNREIQCFTSNETGWTAVKGSVSGNTLTITAQDNTCDDTISWMVIGERQDQHMYDTEWTDENGKVIVEPLKETEQQQQP